MKQPELVINMNCIIGEGPVFDADHKILYWIDILGNTIYSFDFLNSCVDTMVLNQNIGCVAIREKGGLIAALQDGFYFVEFLQKTLKKISDPEIDKPNNRFNDGKCDSSGRLWAGTMSKNLDTGYGEYSPDGSLYCLTTDFDVLKKMDGVILSNGIDWSPDDKTLYFIDSPTRNVQAMNFNSKTGEIGKRRPVIIIPEKLGIPDGMCVDAEGMLWVALWGGGAVTRWDPGNGKMLDKIAIPALNVSSCTFGGDNLDELYVTTARIGTDTSEFPNAGGVFKLEPNVKGLAAYKFKG